MDTIFKPAYDYYSVATGGLPVLNQVYGKARTFDFVKDKSSNYLLDENDTCGIATFQYNGQTTAGGVIESTYPSGIGTGLTYDTTDKSLVLKYTSGDAFTANAARAQLNSYGLPTNTPLLFEFEFKLSTGWPLEYKYDSTYAGLSNSSTLIWQCKASTAVGGPFLSVYVITEAEGAPSILFAYSPTGSGLDGITISKFKNAKADTWYSFKLRTSFFGKSNRLVGSLCGIGFDYTSPTPIWSSLDTNYAAAMSFGIYAYNNNPSTSKSSIIDGTLMSDPNNCKTRALKVRKARVSTSSSYAELNKNVTRKTRTQF